VEPADDDRADAGRFRLQLVRTLRFLVILSVTGAAFPVARTVGLTSGFWWVLGLLFVSNVILPRRPPGGAVPARQVAGLFLCDMAALAYLFLELGEHGDFYLPAALALLVAAVSRGVSGAVVATAVAGTLYAILTFAGVTDAGPASPEILSRLAFFFAFSLFVALLAGETERARKAAQAAGDALDRSQRLLERMADLAPGLLVLVETDGRVIMINRAFEVLAGVRREDAAGRPLAALPVPAAWKEGFSPPCLETSSGGFLAPREVAWRLPDGSERTLEWRCATVPVTDGGHPRILGMGVDVTERKRMDAERARLAERLGQARRMELVGQLAGGVAHDFNNLLFVVNGRAEMELRRLPPGDPGRPALELIRRTGERAAALTRQLLAFSRRQVLQPRPVDLNAVVSGLSGMLRRVIREDIRIETNLAPGLPPAHVDPAQIEQVLLCLAVNARDAMPSGGSLTLRTAAVELEEAFLRNYPDEAKPGPHILLEVADTGVGMDDRVRAHLFEPFFTTREVGRGSGLGLAGAHGVVRQSGGCIDVWSEPGRGSRFRVYLPCSPPAGAGPVPPADRDGLPAGHETILLVEDMDAVRGMVREMLQSLGYTVVEAGNGREALERLAGDEGRIRLLLTDVVMPQMGGAELAEQVRRLRPEVRTLFMSGYAEADTPAADSRHRLLKPVELGELARAVRGVLDATRAD
jgi:PAS domain S-box-containing protein